ncbi:hypothetical protein QSV34_06735 [Porticoccus sp. W117]|uniref:hypothetical protein n=1 Tax=Porticoccus sp. W117 TaxID=3054777 RepID=UPI002598E552|nr:hypothetical protein [Porticoccus sp. W117]MDM3871050.1 hypothetical protein [Porticoccus sp. W117]
MTKLINFKLLAWNIFYVILALVSVPIIFVVAFSLIWPVNSCQEDSEAVAYARSLSSERLGKLYSDMEKYSYRDDLPIGGYQVGHDKYVVPQEFADLKVRKIRPKEGNIMVEGCFDHYIYLDFGGIGRLAKPNDKKEIILSWGEHPPNTGAQVLWSER